MYLYLYTEIGIYAMDNEWTMMAGHVQSLLRIFLLYLTLAAVFKPHICSSSNNLLYLESEAQRWPFENDFGRIYYTILRIQFKRIVAASDKNISFPAFKITKHWVGTACSA
jgi:hypothetical protein